PSLPRPFPLLVRLSLFARSEFPVRGQKFPVPNCREFSGKSLRYRRFLRNNSSFLPPLPLNSLFFPCLTGKIGQARCRHDLGLLLSMSSTAASCMNARRR